MKLRAILLAVLLTVSSIFPFQVSATTSSITAVVDAELIERFTDAITPQQVIVTFKEGSSDRLNLLKTVGITKGVILQELPMAGVLATKAQVEALAQNESVFSIYYNKPLQYGKTEADYYRGH